MEGSGRPTNGRDGAGTEKANEHDQAITDWGEMKAHHRLSKGQMAPKIRIEDWQGEILTLDAMRGEYVLLSFYRYASCPLCNLRIRQIIAGHVELQRQNLRVLAVFQSSGKKIGQYVGTQAPPFPLIPDPDLKLYKAYGVESSWRGFLHAWTMGIGKVFKAVIQKRFLPGTMEGDIHRIPADFLIGPDGRLIDVYYGKDIGDHMPMQQIFDALKSSN